MPHKMSADKCIRLLSQSAEEIAEGALAMIKDSYLEGVNEAYGLHLEP